MGSKVIMRIIQSGKNCYLIFWNSRAFAGKLFSEIIIRNAEFGKCIAIFSGLILRFCYTNGRSMRQTI